MKGTASGAIAMNSKSVIIFTFVLLVGLSLVVSQGYRHAKTALLYNLSACIAEYSAANDKLPPSIKAFCDWKCAVAGHSVWNAAALEKKIAFVWTGSKDELPLKGDLLISILDPTLKGYEKDVNRYLTSRLPPCVFRVE